MVTVTRANKQIYTAANFWKKNSSYVLYYAVLQLMAKILAVVVIWIVLV